MGADAPRHRDPTKVQRKFEAIIGPVREAARQCGYAIAVHGSLARDIDLVAIPWTDEAVDGEALAKVVAVAAAGTGDEWARVGGAMQRTERPHGRVVWVINLVPQTYIDLSVMPRLP